MDLYSVALSLALLAAGVSMLAALVQWVAARKGNAGADAVPRRVARLAALASLPLVAVSLVFHLFTGHRPGTPEGMTTLAFVLEHKAFAGIVLLAALVLWRLRGVGG